MNTLDKVYNLAIDIKNIDVKYNSYAKFFDDDRETSVIRIKLLNDKTPMNLENCIVEAYFILADNTYHNEACKIINSSEGVVELQLCQKCLVKGENIVRLSILKDNEISNTPVITYEVRKGLYSDNPSFNDDPLTPILSQMLLDIKVTKVNQIELQERYEKSLPKIEGKIKEVESLINRVDTAIASGTQDLEVKEARVSVTGKKYQSLKERLDALENNCNLLQGKLYFAPFKKKQGRAEGFISFKNPPVGTLEIYYANDEYVKLNNYSKICTFEVVEDEALYIYELNETNAIPFGAKSIIAIKKETGDIIGYCDIPLKNQVTTSPSFKYGLISDLHISENVEDKHNGYGKVLNAFNFFNSQGLSNIILGGDVATHGTLGEIVRFKEIKDQFPNITVNCCRGNHDTYADCFSLTNYKEYIDENGLYYEKIINGDIYIFLGLVTESAFEPFSIESLDWLENKLETYKNQRVFLFQHVFIEPTGNACDLYPFNDGLITTENSISRRMRDLMSKYKNVVHFSGHSHLEFELSKYEPKANCSQRSENMCSRVHIPSVTRPRMLVDINDISQGVKTDSTKSYGYLVEVYEDFIILKGYDFIEGIFLANHQYIIDTTIVHMEEENEEYPYTTNFTTYVKGSLSSSGADRESSSSYRSDWITVNDNPNKSFRIGSGLCYLRICYYDSNKSFIRMAVDDMYNDGARIPSGTIIDDITEDVSYIKLKVQTVNGGTPDGLIEYNGIDIIEEPMPNEPQEQPYPIDSYIPIEKDDTPPTEPNELLNWELLNFIKRQMNVSSFRTKVAIETGIINLETHQYNIINGYIEGLERAFIIRNKHISVDENYSDEYEGHIAGKWYGSLKYPQQYRVDVYNILDKKYFVESCDLKTDGTWTTSRFEPRKGKKHIELVHKETGKIIEYGRPIVDNYYAKIYKLADLEYECSKCKIFIEDSKYVFYAEDGNEFFNNLKDNESVLVKVFNSKNEVVGIGKNYKNIYHGRIPASYIIPYGDPNYDKEGNNAMGQNGYMMNNRSYIYDIGLSLLAFTISGDYELCKEMLNRMVYEQNSDGSFNFSYDLYIGQLYEPYVRTGSVGWLLWGMCYYTLKSGDKTYIEMIRKCADWVLTRQVSDSNDIRYGLLTGGYGSYNEDYVYSNAEMEWCSTEHNCSTLQGLVGTYEVLKDEKYKNCADLVKRSLINTLWDNTNNRFYQGCDKNGIDEAYALDCLSWAGSVAHSIGEVEKANDCKESILSRFLVTDKTIVKSNQKEFFNQTYELEPGVVLAGFKPYEEGYDNPPEIVWSEGNLGVLLLMNKLSDNVNFDKYLKETLKMKNCIGSTGGVVYTSETRASIPWEFHVWESVVSSAWLYILLNDATALFNV